MKTSEMVRGNERVDIKEVGGRMRDMGAKKEVKPNLKNHILREIENNSFSAKKSILWDGKLIVNFAGDDYKISVTRCSREIDYKELELKAQSIEEKERLIRELQMEIKGMKRNLL